MSALTSGANASIVLGTTRLIYNAEEVEETLQIRNPDNLPKLIQAWIDTGEKYAKPDLIDAPFQILPPVFKISEGKGQALRILALPNSLPKDRESVFWLNVLEVPPRPDKAENENYVQFALRTRIKIFYRPSKLQGLANNAGEKLEWLTINNSLIVNNPTPYYISINSAKILNSKEKKWKSLSIDMIPPFSKKQLKSHKISTFPNQKIEFSYIDDLGAIRNSSSVIQHQ